MSALHHRIPTRHPAPTPPADGFPLITYDDLLESVTSGRFDSFPATITPELAAAVLAEFNVRNRTASKAKVDEYARDMAAGRWVDKCGQSISFNVRSELDNGQNRLMACVQSGRPFPVLIVVGNDPEAFDAIDRGKKRTKADTLTYHGEANATTLAAALGLFVRWEANRFAKTYSPTESEILAARDRHPQAVNWASRISNIRSKTGCAPGPMVFVMTMVDEAHPDLAGPFADRLVSGANLDEDDPILVLREHLRSRKGDGRKNGRDSQVVQSACIVKAWNAHHAGRKIGHLRFVDGERFPDVK